jgi:transposase
MMGPLLRRSWSPCGRTPVLHQRGRSRLKVSVIGALSVSPHRRRVRAWFAFAPQASFDGQRIIAFLRELLRTLRCRIVLVWDRLQAHHGEPVKSWLRANRHRIRAELLPAYAPELNPVELIWGYAKTNPLANAAPTTLPQLLEQTTSSTTAIAANQPLLRSLLRHCPLSLRLK